MRFTPKNAIDQRFFKVGKNTSDFKVGERVVMTWSDGWAKTLSEKINAKYHDTTMYNPSYWFNTNLEKNITNLVMMIQQHMNKMKVLQN